MPTLPIFSDRYGLPLSTGSAAAVDHYSEGMDRQRAINVGTEEALRQAIAADEGFALAHAALAYVLQFRGRTEEAKASAARAQELTGGITRRERQHVAAIASFVEGGGPRVLDLVQEHLAEFPRDATVLGLGNLALTNSGRQDRREAAFALCQQVAPAYGDDDWYFLSTSAFVHQELDQHALAQRLAERSLARYPRAGNASHTLAHVFYETNDHAAGAAFLGHWMVDYDRQAPQHCHYSWHLALFALAAGQYDQAMELYERDIRPALGQTRSSMYDAASLLWRMSVYGSTTAPLPWQEVCNLAGQITARPGMAFNDAHGALALAGAGDEAALGRLMDGLRALDAKGHPTAGSLVLPLAQGVAAFAREDYPEAVAQLEPVMAQVVRLGGSNAQREVFEDTLLEAYLRAGRFDQAETLVRKRLDRRPSARDYFWLGRAQTGAGQGEAAVSSLKTAQESWESADPDGAERSALARLRHGLGTT